MEPVIDIYIHEDHSMLMKKLVRRDGEQTGMFQDLYDLISFASALGKIENKKGLPPNECKKADTDRGRKTVKMNNSTRSEAILSDVIAINDQISENTLLPFDAAAVLSDEKKRERAQEMNAYAHGGLQIIEQTKEQEGDYSSAVHKLIKDLLPDE